MVLSPDFSPVIPDVLPPCSIEAEAAVLGCLMFDSDAIDKVKSRLKPEHFYISTHRDIYRACLKLCKKSRIDLLTLTDYLRSQEILQKVGGKNKLSELFESIVSAHNVEEFANLVIEKSVRRELISLGYKTMQLGYATEMELDEVLCIIRKSTESVTGLESVQTEEENNLYQFNKLIDKLKEIYTKVVEPDYRLWRLQRLAQEVGKSTKFLEELYARHLVQKVVSPRITYEELKEVSKSSVKEWLIQGMFPKRTTGIVYGSGGILKTKLLYHIIMAIIQGKNLGEFSATGKQRKILIYQGDERESDTTAALEIMGFSREQIGQYVEFRYNWSFEHMPLLLKDLQEYKPELVLIDSLTFAGRFSNYTENEVAYSRPILELTGLANEYDTSFMLIHHANKNGELRGSSAIFNAVSEVWKIEKDNSPHATPNDRFLSVEKSRSRSSGKKYRLIFEPENLGFVFAGEEETDITKQVDSTCKTKILEFLRRHPNIKYTAEDVCGNIDYARVTVNKALSCLVSDGLVQVSRGNGRTPYTYYLSFEGLNPFATPPTPPNNTEEQHRSSIGVAAYNSDGASVSGFADTPDTQNSENFSEFENQKREKIVSAYQQTSQPMSSKESLLILNQNQQEEQQEQQEQQKKEENMCYNPESSKAFESQYKGILSDWNIKYLQSMKTALITIECHSEKLDLTLQEVTNSQDAEHAKRCAERLISETESRIAINSDRLFKVQQLGDDDYIYIEKCQMIMVPDFARHRHNWLFEAPNGEKLRAASMEEFEVMP